MHGLSPRQGTLKALPFPVLFLFGKGMLILSLPRLKV